MTATEDLRRLLDERGVEWVRGVYNDGIVEWEGANGRICRAFERNEPITVDVDILAVTPAQAVEATLGRGECRFMPFEGEDESEPNAVRGVCSECSALMYGKDKYCAECGRKVVS